MLPQATRQGEYPNDSWVRASWIAGELSGRRRALDESDTNHRSRRRSSRFLWPVCESVQKVPCARTKTDVQGVIRLQTASCNSPRRYGGNMYQIGRMPWRVRVSPAPSHVSRDGRRDPRHRRRRIKPVSSGHPLETENFCRPLDLALNVLKLDHTAN
jgi:hypothetical protein